jgi:hypothetical protein
MKKIILIGGGLVVVVIVAAVFLFASNIDALVKTAVEKGGSEATQVKVTLAKAEVKLTEGSASLSGLVVGNPDGFKTDSAFELGAISVKIDTATITQDPVIIKEVVITKPKVTYEIGSNGSNIDAIKRNVEKLAGGGGGSASSGGEEGPKVIIEHLYLRDAEVNVSATMLGGKTMSSTLPEIHLTDIGKDKGGANPGEVASKVMAALTSKVGGFVSNLDLSSVLEGATNLPESLKGMAGGAAEKASEALKGVTSGDAASGAGDAVKEAGGALKKLFGN